MAHIKHKLEILVNIDEPIAEIQNVISAFLRLHPAREYEILSALKRDIDEAVTQIDQSKGGDDA